jgi:hypothetical protein
VNSEPKPFASLSSGLLARKGAAKPAMRPQGFGQVGAGLEDLGWNDMGFEPPKAAPVSDADVDSADAVPHPTRNLAGLTPVDSPVHGQQAEIAGRLSSYSPEDEGEEDEEIAELDDAPVPFKALVKPEPVAEAIAPVAPVAPIVVPIDSAPALKRAPKARSVAGSKGKAAFTLRLDTERHLKLRLACAVGGRSAQLLVTQALDNLLASMPELDAMAEKAKRKG